MNDRPRTIPIHLSLIRPILLMGAERELVLISGILAAVLVMSLARLLFTVVGVVFWALEPRGVATRGEVRSAVHPRLSAPHALPCATMRRSRARRRAFQPCGRACRAKLARVSLHGKGSAGSAQLRRGRRRRRRAQQRRQPHGGVDVSWRRSRFGQRAGALRALGARQRGVRAARQRLDGARRRAAYRGARLSGGRGLSRSHDAAHRRGAARGLRGRRRALREPLRALRHLPSADRRAARDCELLRRGRPAAGARRHGLASAGDLRRRACGNRG